MTLDQNRPTQPNPVVQIVSAFFSFVILKSHIIVVLFILVLVASRIPMISLKISKTKNTISLLKPQFHSQGFSQRK